ncbi:hypothetical protein BSCG_04618 [Bacteroides sp. 2_2_4]|nr:hypothetical protein BSCG_04618 [Bacteroides sp. 2_2_4]
MPSIHLSNSVGACFSKGFTTQFDKEPKAMRSVPKLLNKRRITFTTDNCNKGDSSFIKVLYCPLISNSH